MIVRKIVRSIVMVTSGAALLLPLPVAAGDTPAGMPPRAAPQMPHGMAGMPHDPAAAMLHSEAAKPMELTDAQLKSFFAAVDELRALGDKGAAIQPGKAAAYAKGMQLSSEGLAVLKKNGFKDALEFQRVGYNAAMAYGVLKQGGKEAFRKKMEKAKSKQADAMKELSQHLTPEQMKAMEAHMKSGMAIAESMQHVPDGNIELIKKYREQMEKLGKK